jgi:hypothetical protein
MEPAISSSRANGVCELVTSLRERDIFKGLKYVTYEYCTRMYVK